MVDQRGPDDDGLRRIFADELEDKEIGEGGFFIGGRQALRCACRELPRRPTHCCYRDTGSPYQGGGRAPRRGECVRGAAVLL